MFPSDFIACFRLAAELTFGGVGGWEWTAETESVQMGSISCSTAGHLGEKTPRPSSSLSKQFKNFLA